MRRRLTTSVLFAGLLAGTVAGQTSPPVPAPGSAKQPAEKKADKKAADPTDAAVAAALAHDPDVKIAQAKVQLAEAELAKAKQGVVMKVMALSAAVKEHRQLVEQARERAEWADQMHKTARIPAVEARAERAKLEAAQAALARAETELKFLTGEPAAKSADAGAVERLLYMHSLQRAHDAWSLEQRDREQHLRDYYSRSFDAQAYWSLRSVMAGATVKGPVPDRIRAALDKPVRLGAKGEKVSFEKALEVFKQEAGLDVPVRGQATTLPVDAGGDTLPVGAWFQLFADTNPDVRVLVREYGLLVTFKDGVPPDAPTVVEFWKQKPPAKEKETAPEAKGK